MVYCHNIQTSKSLAVNLWHHIAITADGNTAKFYADGQRFYSSSYSNNITYPLSNAFVIGKTAYSYSTPASSQNPFNGVISDVRIYATALDENAIMELYHTPISVANSGTILTQGEYIEDNNVSSPGLYHSGDIVTPMTIFGSNDLPDTVTQPSYAVALSPHGFVESGSLAKIYDGHIMTNEFIEA